MLLRYFTRHSLPKSELNRAFFLSYEDALWHLLKVDGIQDGATILVPEFFCGDVIHNMEGHKLHVVSYPVGPLLTTTTKQFAKALVSTKPNIVVIFHAVGIKNSLLTAYKSWQKYLPPECLIIEDSVHLLLRRDKVRLLSSRHYVIDSLRKVAPVQGSYLYSNDVLPSVSSSQALLTLPYRLGVHLLWAMMQLFLVLACYLPGTLNKFANLFAEYLMLVGYDLIGKSRLAAPGSPVMHWLASHLDYDAVAQAKQTQARTYHQALRPVLRRGAVWLPTMREADLSELRGFPLIINYRLAPKLLTDLRRRGLILRFELDDSPWSRRQKIIYLPMGLHVRDKDITSITSIINHTATSVIIDQ